MKDELPPGGERLQKLLARLGFASRREIEGWITNGRITLNGRYAKLGDRYQPGDKLTVNGRQIDPERQGPEATRVLIYHKPTGEVVTRRDPEGRTTIFTQLPKPERGRWIAIGRLDINTQGLLLVTTNGELANRLMHPSHEIEREYAVRVMGRIDDGMLKRLQEGVELEDGPARFETLRSAGGEGSNHWFHVTLKEGRNRIVRRLWESQGVMVSRLMRVRFAGIELPPRVRAKAYLELPPEEVKLLMASVGMAADDSDLSSQPKKRDSETKKPVRKPAPERGSKRLRNRERF